MLVDKPTHCNAVSMTASNKTAAVFSLCAVSLNMRLFNEKKGNTFAGLWTINSRHPKLQLIGTKCRVILVRLMHLYHYKESGLAYIFIKTLMSHCFTTAWWHPV